METTPIQRIARRLHRMVHGPASGELVSCSNCGDPVLAEASIREHRYNYCTAECAAEHFQSQF